MTIPIKEWLWPNISTFFVTLVVLIIMFVLFKKYLFSPMRYFLAQRQRHITDTMKEAIAKNIKADRTLAAAKKHFDKTILEGQKLIISNKMEATSTAEKIITGAKVDAVTLTEQTKHRLANNEREMRNSFQKEIADISIQAAGKILTKELDDKTNRKIVADFIKESYEKTNS